VYIPQHFDEPSVAVMHELIRAQPLATLVTLSPQGLNANHIPLHLANEAPPYGVLRGHVARANPMWLDLQANIEVLTIFHGADAYISPAWYATKNKHGKVVPTWNYAVVHAYGTLRVIDDVTWIRAQLEALTGHQEHQSHSPWAVSDAPQEFIEKLIQSIVGIEIVISRLMGKWKVSQNQPASNQIGVIDGLNQYESQNATEMAAMIKHKM
jgi:transcriptional regulator